MGINKGLKNRRVSPRLKSKGCLNESEMPSMTLMSNGSESSVSTCDTIGFKRSPHLINKNNKKISNSVKNDDFLNSDTESDDKPIEKGEKICRRCDQLLCQLTDMRIQDYDNWLSEIKTYQDMLYQKESIIESLQKELTTKESEIGKLKKDVTTASNMNNKLEKKIVALNNKIEVKDGQINELESSIKEKNDNVSLYKRRIDKLEKLAEEDSKLIKKLRSVPDE